MDVWTVRSTQTGRLVSRHASMKEAAQKARSFANGTGPAAVVHEHPVKVEVKKVYLGRARDVVQTSPVRGKIPREKIQRAIAQVRIERSLAESR